MLHPKKVGTLPVADRDEEKQTNEIKTAIPLLQAIDIEGKTITADALPFHRQRQSKDTVRSHRFLFRLP